MKLNAIILIGVLILTAACSNDENTMLKIDGKYTGTFKRDNNVANVEIEFINGKFLGNSTGDGYLIPIYHGEYSINGDIIVFDNKQLVLPAIYDSSTLLDGKWNFTFDQNTLTMIKSNGDKYALMKN
ncbi:hypothetical protein [Maribacter luteus]|uniref:Lipocalin-like domain-containing protein n=1 Tax=Maribacter luteus TaxID=2594478 RepID=A0A6I2MQN4_9FLAO|nr:hypothetical protein [Maribacter luteus]MRX64760.1 hypothetical protein [Maribacter luteus]